jgi:hypothetical protein
MKTIGTPGNLSTTVTICCMKVIYPFRPRAIR